jgi:hypothetical protein
MRETEVQIGNSDLHVLAKHSFRGSVKTKQQARVLWEPYHPTDRLQLLVGKHLA